MKYIDISSRDYGRLLDNSEYYRVTYSNGLQIFHLNGIRHRDDGAAVRTSDGELYYYLKGIRYDRFDFMKKLSRSMLKRFLLNSDNFI